MRINFGKFTITLITLVMLSFSAAAGSVSEISINDLPSTHNVEDSLEIKGSATGSNLDEIVIQGREEGDITWDHLKTKDCKGGDACSLEKNYAVSSSSTQEFKIVAEAGEKFDDSNVETVEFTEDTQDEISVSLVSPKNGATDISTRPTLRIDGYNPDGDESDLRYTYVIDKGDSIDAYPDREVVTYDDTLDVGVQTGSFEANQKYSWKAKVEDNDDGDLETDAVSETWTFTTGDSDSGDGTGDDDSDSGGDSDDGTGDDNTDGDDGTDDGDSDYGTGDDDSDDSVNLDASFSYSPESPEEGEKVSFDASSSDGDISEYDWSFGDSWTGSGKSTSHTYMDNGNYDVRLTVEDDQGNSDTTEKTITVVDDTDQCPVDVSSLRLDPDQIFEDESSEVSLQVANDGDQEQRLSKVKIYSKYDTYLEKGVTVDANNERTFSTDISPDQDTFIKAEVVTKGDPCGTQKFQPGNKELTVFQRSGSGADGNADLEVNVEDEDGDNLEDARVEIENGHREVEYTDSDGDAQFNNIEADRYDIEVSKSGYDQEEETVTLDEGEDRTVNFELERDRDNDDAYLKVLVEDRDGDRLRDARVRVENGDRETEYTDRDGRADFFLEPDRYDIKVSKSGYETRERSTRLSEDEDETLVFRLQDDDFDDGGLEITHVDYPSSVCRGGSFTADVTVKNNEDIFKMVTLTGSGLGSTNIGESFPLKEDHLKIRNIVFTNVEGSGTEHFTITASNHDSDKVTRSIQVENCDISNVPDGDTATGLTMDVKPTETVINKPVKVKGYVRGVRDRSRVNIEVNGVRKASVTTQPDGYYQAYITPTSPGRQTITARTGTARASQEINVVPTASVLSVDTPQKVFEGEKFEICADVESEVSPKLYLLKDDKVVESQYGSGEVCFTRTAEDVGTHRYTVKALTYGKESSSSTSVEVLKSDSEVESFPDKVASVESEESMVKVRLYNTHEEPRRYQIRLSGLPSTWTAQTDKEVILPKGGEDTVYFYLTPREEGNYNPTIEVESEGASIFQQEVTLESGGTKNPRQKSLIESVFSLFGF